MKHKKLLAVLLLCLTSSCQDIVIVEAKRGGDSILDKGSFYYMDRLVGLTKCPDEWEPVLPSMPEKPFIPEAYKGNRIKEEVILVDNIDVLREQIRELQGIIHNYPASLAAECSKYPFTE